MIGAAVKRVAQIFVSARAVVFQGVNKKGTAEAAT